MEKIAVAFNRVKNSEKNKEKLIKQQIETKKEKHDQRMEVTMANFRQIKLEQKDKYNYLNEKNEQRAKLIFEIKEAIKEDIDLKKEISNLKKKDQMENL
jgi:adenylosuccinate synthase